MPGPDTHGQFTNPLNLFFLIQRQVSLELDKDITTRTYMMVFTCPYRKLYPRWNRGWDGLG
jgi:hypothetical protein